ncbi:MAG TPA: type II secretion system protein GspJ [Tepidisphaeraceae bacterium]
MVEDASGAAQGEMWENQLAGIGHFLAAIQKVVPLSKLGFPKSRASRMVLPPDHGLEAHATKRGIANGYLVRAGIRSHRYSRGARHGFTLLELLIALTISAVVALSMFSSLYIVFKSRENSMAALAPVASAELAMEMIRADIQSALPEAPATGTTSGLPGGISAQTTTAAPLIGPFEGTQGGGTAGGDALYLYGTGYIPPHKSGVGDVKQIALMMDQQNNTKVLVREVWGNLLSQQAQTLDPDKEVICRYVTSFTLQYYDGTQWQTSWDSTQYNNSLPVAVEVTLELMPPGVKQPIHMRRVFGLSCLTPPTPIQ